MRQGHGEESYKQAFGTEVKADFLEETEKEMNKAEFSGAVYGACRSLRIMHNNYNRCGKNLDLPDTQNQGDDGESDPGQKR